MIEKVRAVQSYSSDIGCQFPFTLTTNLNGLALNGLAAMYLSDLLKQYKLILRPLFS